MITRLIFSMAIMTLSLIVKGQEKIVQYGFHGGINLNSSHGSSSINDQTSMVVGYNLGGHIKWRLTNHLGFKAIMQYEQIGWALRGLSFENSTGTGLVEGDVQYKLGYLNLPLLVEYESGQKIKFNFNAGIFVGTLINNKVVFTTKDPPSTSSTPTSLKSLNYGISTGIGTQIPINTNLYLAFDVRNNLGLADISKSASTSQSTQKTNSFQISSGLVFRL